MTSPVEHEFDVELTPRDLQSLSSADAVAAFFARLGYDTNSRLEQSPENLGITAETTRRPIRRIERLADQEGLFQVYLFELTSVTVAETRALARAFRNLSGNFLLVLTASDFERLDFVLLERHVPSGAAKAGIGTRQAGVRPRVLTVDRRNADRVQLRVLRRLTWTEPDPFAQFNKIQSAYAVADWSEEHFNNRALFADYFLLERLREFEEWREDLKPAYRALRDLYRGGSARLAGEKESVIREQLLEPVLEVLGFTFTPGKEAGSEAAQPDYRLLSPEGGTRPLAFCLAYPWDRFLDGKDYTRDAESPEENPGALVVSLLETGEAPWAVVTNGRLWRLYSQKTYAKATNYYEIDLEEVLAQTGPHAPDPSEAFRYFWLLFRRAAFVEAQATVDGAQVARSFLDRLLHGSEDYAKELGARLKDRVFIEVFPHLATGFISDIHSSRPTTDILTESELAEVFQGTLTLLYRLLFLLYAEARDLLPVKEVRGYYEASLKKMKAEVEEAAGEIDDEVEAKLKKAYRTDTFVLYERLQKLCRIVDRGESTLNVPFYNGGLFISDPPPDGDNPESQAARFLGRCKVPDRPLALAIDLLSRDIDERRQSLVFIDYKSLGVRQLGSIYEGLLEFKLRTADQNLGVVKSKGKEVYKPFRELTDRQKTAAARNKQVVRKGQVYLENDKRERKATGSYYTPDHIVKYMVREAVGPVLSKKLEALRPKLREAQRWHRERLAQAEAKGESPDKYRYGQAVVTRWAQELIDPVFDIKVLDPAMGSGHFLVEAVDFVTDKLIDFLAAFPWNPVLANLERTRETILAEMDRQEVSVDPSRLTDVNLLKRHVLKRCVYGVDLNPMAVELAKVSLWLHCFTLGAPLSFLDHHLRCGNSLLGTTVEEVDEILEEKGQLTLSATSAWQGLLQAVQGMITVGGLPDVTVEQVAGSRSSYHDALVGLEPFKRILDVHLARWFLRDVGAGAGKGGADPFSEVIRNPELLDWVSERGAPTLDAGPKLELLHAVRTEAKTRRFFHWELEFPEVFYRRGGHIPDEGGFDALVTNPPYLFLTAVPAFDRDFYRGTFESVAYRFDLYGAFIEQAISSLVGKERRCGFIVPHTLLSNDSFSKLRELLASKARLHRVVDLGPGVFEGASNEVMLLFLEACVPGIADRVDVVVTDADRFPEEESRFRVPQLEWASGGEPWSVLANPASLPVLTKLESAHQTLGDFCHVNQGLRTGDNEKYLSSLRANESWKPAAGGSEVGRYLPVEPGLYVLYEPELLDAPRRAEIFESEEKIVVQEVRNITLRRRLVGTLDYGRTYCLQSTNVINLKEGVQRDLRFLLGIVNSKIINQFFRLKYSGNNHIPANLVARIPIPKASKEDEVLIAKLADELLDLYALSKKAEGKGRETNVEAIERREALLEEAVCRSFEISAEEVERFLDQ